MKSCVHLKKRKTGEKQSVNLILITLSLFIKKLLQTEAQNHLVTVIVLNLQYEQKSTAVAF